MNHKNHEEMLALRAEQAEARVAELERFLAAIDRQLDEVGAPTMMGGARLPPVFRIKALADLCGGVDIQALAVRVAALEHHHQQELTRLQQQLERGQVRLEELERNR